MRPGDKVGNRFAHWIRWCELQLDSGIPALGSDPLRNAVTNER